MKLSRQKPPKDRDVKVDVRFAFLPVRTNGGVVWLEWVECHYTYDAFNGWSLEYVRELE